MIPKEKSGWISNQEIRQKAEALWVRVKLDWENEVLHQQFVDYCSAHYLLHFTAQKYQNRKQSHGTSPLLEKYLEQIVLITQFKFIPDDQKEKKEKAGFIARLFTVPNFLLSAGVTIILYSLTSTRIAVGLFVGLFLLGLGGYLVFRNLSRRISLRE